MKFIEIHQSYNLRYAFYEVESNLKNNQSSFDQGKQYIWAYKLVSHFSRPRKLIISSENITFTENKTEILVPKSSHTEIETIFSIIFTPKTNTDSVKINLFIEKSFREPEIILIRKNLLADKNKPEIKIEGQLGNSVPRIMKVGEQKQIIFLFKNESQQPATGVNIIIQPCA